MKKICISKDWMLDAPGFHGKVDLPNDYSVTLPRTPDAAGGASNGFFPSGIGTYTKYLKLDDTSRHYILDIDGAYMCTTVTFNEYRMVMHPHGYTPLLVDLTDRVHPGKTNRLVISTNALQPSTRWYAGAGIYRDVYLWEGGDIRLEPWDLFITTPSLDSVHLACEIRADREANVRIRAEIFFADRPVTSEETEIAVKAGKKTPAGLAFSIPDAKLWDTENPNLYTMRVTLLEDDRVLDTDERRFGIRTVTADAKNGLLLNGKPIKLRGGCIHHDHGVLGAADYPAACRRKLTRLKEVGFNALRIAHNPPSLQLLEMCDEMGIIVMDEAFDCWQREKGGSLNYHVWFTDWWARDISYMVLRDRNHPCVIAYSTGNEIPESDGASDGDEWSSRLAAEIRKYDSTRLVTSATWQMPASCASDAPEDYKKDFSERMENGDNHSWASRTAGYFKPYDICGYNYMYGRYAEDHKRFPERVIWGSETHVIHFYDSWKTVTENSYVIGDFTWTAYDNLGEAGTGRSCWARDGYIPGISLAAYPWRSCYQGDLDLCGYRRPQSYFREAIWNPDAEPKIFTTHPEHYGEGFSGTGWHWYDVLDTWNFDDAYIGKPVRCELYTTADEVAWYKNGTLLGKSRPEKAIASFDILYERGEIAAEVYKNGEMLHRVTLGTVGEPAAIRVSAESRVLTADNRDLCYFDITVTDDDGCRIPDAKNALTCLVDGGELLGIFSGDPCNEDAYGSNQCHAFEGRAVAIVRTDRPGKVTVTVGSCRLRSGSDSVSAQ